jgi:hypothetical protein
MVQTTAEELGWTLMRGNLKPCNAYATGKAKQKNVPQVSKHQVAKVNKTRVFLESPNEGPKVTKLADYG